MNLDGQFANERFMQETDDLPLEASQSPSEERELVAPSSAPLSSYSEDREQDGFEEDGEGYDRFYRVGY